MKLFSINLFNCSLSHSYAKIFLLRPINPVVFSFLTALHSLETWRNSMNEFFPIVTLKNYIKITCKGEWTDKTITSSRLSTSFRKLVEPASVKNRNAGTFKCYPWFTMRNSPTQDTRGLLKIIRKKTTSQKQLLWTIK